MPKATRRTGASNAAAGGHQRVLTRTDGFDVDVAGDLTVAGGLHAPGGLITSDFRGFDLEDVAFPATSLQVPQGGNPSNILNSSNFTRRELPSGVTTTLVVGGFNFPDWWEACDIHIGWTNEGADVTGTVIWAFNLREVNIGEAISAGTLIGTGLLPLAPPANGVLTTSILQAKVDLRPNDGLGYVLGFEIGRIGGSDSISNSIGLAAVGFSRLDP